MSDQLTRPSPNSKAVLTKLYPYLDAEAYRTASAYVRRQTSTPTWARVSERTAALQIYKVLSFPLNPSSVVGNTKNGKRLNHHIKSPRISPTSCATPSVELETRPIRPSAQVRPRHPRSLGMQLALCPSISAGSLWPCLER